MTTLDHRILIPAPGPVVWGYLSQIENNDTWQADCAGITFLSQKRHGVGTRWRQRSTGRYEVVYEITTWYDGLGYEYTLIDGAPHKSVEARLRLQEIAEGTIVQWTFNYELGGGVLGDLRNALSTERRQNQAIITSLKNLWKETKRLGSLDGYTPRSLMSDGPPIAENKRLQSTEEEAIPLASLSELEPPISDEDTRPRDISPTTQSSSAPEETNIDSEATPTSESDQRFAPPSQTSSSTEETDADAAPTSLQADIPEKPISTSTHETEPQELETPSTLDEETFSPRIPEGKDTSEVSIWEVFGVPSPTDTQKMRAIRVAQEAEAEYDAETGSEKGTGLADVVQSSTETFDATDTGNRTGLRGRLRRKSAKVRYPGDHEN